MADRVTQTNVEAVGDGDPRARVTQTTADVVGDGNPKARITQESVEVIADGPIEIDVTQVSVEVIGDVVAHAVNVRTTQNSIEVIAEPDVEILTESPLYTAWLGDPYSNFIVATGGLGPLTWAVTGGTTPAGFSINSATGEITGPMTQAGTFVFDITVSDNHGHDDTVTYTLLVDTLTDAEANQTENVNLGIGVFGLGYTIARGLSGVEAHFEMTDMGLGTDTGGIAYRRTLSYFPRDWFPDDQLFYLEAIGSNSGNIPSVWNVTNSLTLPTYVQTLTIPPGYSGRIRNSVPFDGPAGYYLITANAMEGLNEAGVDAFRIVAPLRNGQEFVSEIRLTNSGQGTTTDQNFASGDVARTSSAGHANFDDAWVSAGHPVWRYEAAAWERVSSIFLQIVVSNASFFDQVDFKFSEIAFVDIDDIGEFLFRRKISTQGFDVFMNPSVFEIPINPTSLRDGHRYQIYFRSVKPDGFFTFNTFLNKARILMRMEPGNKSEIYNRCAPSERVYMPGFMTPNPEIYFQVESSASPETVTLVHMGASTPAGNTTGGPGTSTGVSLLTVADESVRSAEISDLLVAGRDYLAGLGNASQAELVYRFGNVVRHRTHNYMF